MHRKNPISVLVYNALFPQPSPTDPPSFSAHLSKNLVGEVRIETANFYGSLDTIEARYPGLNYAFAPHRKRLGRFPHHRRLFEAFDRLGLTEAEILGFCRWEGTLWARQRYERDEGVRVIDTTGVEIGEWVDRRKLHISHPAKSINVKTDIEVEIEQVPPTPRRPSSPYPDTQMRDDDDEEEDEDEESDEDQTQDQPPNYRIQQARHDYLPFTNRTQTSAHLQRATLTQYSHTSPLPTNDTEWEQYLKDAQERGDLSHPEAARDVMVNLASQIAHSMTSGGRTPYTAMLLGVGPQMADAAAGVGLVEGSTPTAGGVGGGGGDAGSGGTSAPRATAPA